MPVLCRIMFATDRDGLWMCLPVTYRLAIGFLSGEGKALGRPLTFVLHPAAICAPVILAS